MSSKKWQQVNSVNNKSLRLSKRSKLLIVSVFALLVLGAIASLLFVNVINGSKQKVLVDSSNQLLNALFADESVSFDGSILINQPEDKDLKSVKVSYSGKTENGVLVDGDAAVNIELTANYVKNQVKIYPKFLKQNGKTYVKFDDIRYNLKQLSLINQTKFSNDGVNLLSDKLKFTEGQWINISDIKPKFFSERCRAKISQNRLQLTGKSGQNKLLSSGLVDSFTKLDNQKINGNESFHFALNLKSNVEERMKSLLPTDVYAECSNDVKVLTSGVSELEIWVNKTNHKIAKILISTTNSGVSTSYTLSYKIETKFIKNEQASSVELSEVIKTIEEVIGTPIKNVL